VEMLRELDLLRDLQFLKELDLLREIHLLSGSEREERSKGQEERR
jgi:hypothetical protein